MPFYEYECTKCGHHEEVLQSINEKPLTRCTKCGKPAFKKLVSAPVFRLKGSGWYETDFKSDQENKRNLAGADKEDAKDSKAEAKAEAKTDAKPEAKPEAKTESKSESAKPAPVKPVAKRPAAKSKSKPARTAKRLARR
ncbi:MAG TPA: FmdB family zinc ribbon protein [Steroidobacteraceae bacterium]|nr:FmdB family zinc ribbon protein [Steroidobacteraceae bacterium]